MALFKWNDSFSVKIEELDSQHKKLVDYMNQLFDLMNNRGTLEQVKPVLNSLVSYTRTHFKTEEALFDQYGYPETAAHKQEHIDFIEKVEDFFKDFNSGKLTLSIDVMNFLKKWLTNHIQGSDKAYSTFLNSKGVS